MKCCDNIATATVEKRSISFLTYGLAVLEHWRPWSSNSSIGDAVARHSAAVVVVVDAADTKRSNNTHPPAACMHALHRSPSDGQHT
jgi:hypothetical protein